MVTSLLRGPKKDGKNSRNVKSCLIKDLHATTLLSLITDEKHSVTADK